jgi:hypothetical protein
MLKKLDLASIAEEIVTPYRPIPLASLPQLEVSLFICQGARSWRRQEANGMMYLVLEGVITLDGPTGKMVVNEGEVASVPRNASHGAYSGMRSSVVLIEERRSDGSSNGHQVPPTTEVPSLGKVNLAVDVAQATPMEWLPSGSAGGYAAFATRLRGTSEPYVVPTGALLMLVYRGTLDYAAAGGTDSLVGSQMLVAPSGSELAFESEHGATVLVLARKASRLPVPSAAGPTDQDRGSDRWDDSALP